MKTKLHGSVIVIAATALALGLCACGKKQAAAFQPPPAMVTMAASVQQDTPVVITAYGAIQERESVDVIPQVSGILLSILVQEGAVVTNGQALFQIDPRDYQVRVEQAESMTAVDRANLDLARSTLQRNQSLLEKRLISPDTFDIIKTKVAALESQLRMDEAGLAQARLNLARCTIAAPISGVCSKRYVDAGNLVSAGMSRLINLRSYDPLRLETSVSEQYLPALRSAMAAGALAVAVTPRGDTNRYGGTLSFMDNAVNPVAGTILLRGEIPNPTLKLWANQFVDVQITVGSIPGAILVPESAVQLGKRGPYLYVVGADQKATMKPVKTGVRHNDWIQITEGVAAGETVVSLGQIKLYPGATAMDPAKMPAAAGTNPH
jgi:multidrug efflux system membrane fusion protein